MTAVSDLTLAANLSGPTHRSFWVVPGRLAAGAYPGKRERGVDLHIEVLEELLAAGIDTFINLTQDRPGGTDAHLDRYDGVLAGRGTVLRFGIPDVDIPVAAAMAATLDAVDRLLERGRNVYIHCWGGVGRTGTVVGCWLIRHGMATSAESIDVLAELRRGDLGAGHRLAPETDHQRDFVRHWRSGR